MTDHLHIGAPFTQIIPSRAPIVPPPFLLPFRIHAGFPNPSLDSASAFRNGSCPAGDSREDPSIPRPLRASWRRLVRLGVRSPSNSHAGPRPIRPGARASLPGGKRSGVMETALPPPWGCFPVSFCYCRWDAAMERLSGAFLSCDGLWTELTLALIPSCSAAIVQLVYQNREIGQVICRPVCTVYLK